VAVHHGGGVGMGKSIHAGAQVVADGTDDGGRAPRTGAHQRPGDGVLRHADAGYGRARQVAGERGVRIPMGPA
jgi:urocanate hydratase